MAVWTIAASTEPNGGPLPPRSAMLWSATSFQNTTAFVVWRSPFDSLSHPRSSFCCAKATVAASAATKHACPIMVFLLFGSASDNGRLLIESDDERKDGHSRENCRKEVRHPGVGRGR